MSTQGRTSDQTEQPPQSEAQPAQTSPDEGTNLLHRWVRLVQQSSLWGNDAGQVSLDELAQGPTTPRIQTLEEIRAARAAAVAEEDAAESAGSISWWEDAICADDEAEAMPADEVCETEPLLEVEDPPVCELDDAASELGERASDDGGYALDPQLSEMPPIFTLPPLVTPPTTVSPIPPALPAAAGEGLLSRVLAFGARRLLPIIVGLWPKDTAPPELDQVPYTGPEGGLEPVSDGLPKDDNKCKAEAVKHRGGEEIHDACADSVPGNEIPGKDLLVTTQEGQKKNFDAWTRSDNSVWEVKTDNFAGKSAKWIQLVTQWQLPALEYEEQIANKCGYSFKVSVSDPAHYEALRDRFDVVYRPDCLRDSNETGATPTSEP